MALTKVRGGGVDTLVLADSTNLNFGTSSDAKIFHDGNNTKFQHTGTGGLYVGADTFAITMVLQTLTIYPLILMVMLPFQNNLLFLPFHLETKIILQVEIQ